VSTPQQFVTPAAPAFLENIDRLGQFLELIPDADRSARASLPESPLAPVLRPSNPDAIDGHGSPAAFALQWYGVMLVTVAETYLQDVLAFAAELDPSLMAKSEASARYEDVIAADSVQDLADELRARWARGFVDDGGPRRWTERLTRMGARFPSELGERMEPLWGARHVVIHRAGTVTRDFARRHRNLGLDAGHELILPRKFWLDVTMDVAVFQRETESYFNTRYQREIQSWFADEDGASEHGAPPA